MAGYGAVVLVTAGSKTTQLEAWQQIKRGIVIGTGQDSAGAIEINKTISRI